MKLLLSIFLLSISLFMHGQIFNVNFFVIDSIDSKNIKIYANLKEQRCFLYLNDKEKYLLGVDVLEEMRSLDYASYMKAFKDYDNHFEYPMLINSDRCSEKEQEVRYKEPPRKYIALLIRGSYYNHLTISCHGPAPYPFKDKKAFYLIFVPWW